MPNNVPQGSIADLEREQFIMSTAVPGQVGSVVLNPDGTNIGGGGGGGAVTVADGADVAEGATTAAATVGDTNGPITGKLRGLSVQTGIVTETAPATDTASSGLNGRLQRIAQRLTSLIALLPASLGQKIMSGSLSVAIASDQSSLPTNSAQASRVTGTVTNNATSITATVSQYSVVTVTFNGTYSGITMNFEASDDGGTTWYSVLGSLSSSTTSAVTSVALATNATSMYNVTLPGITNFRVRSSAYSSGTLNVGITATADPMVFNVASGIVGTPPFNITQVAGNSIATAGVNGTLGVGGNVATNVAIGTNPINLGAQAVSAENAAVTATRMVQLVADLAGKLIVMPYANKENLVKGSATTTGTSDTSVVASAGGSLRNYITGGTVYNSGATTATITVKDGSGGSTLFTTIAPAGGGSNFTLPTPVFGTAATAVYFAAGSSSTTIGISLVGYSGT